MLSSWPASINSNLLPGQALQARGGERVISDEGMDGMQPAARPQAGQPVSRYKYYFNIGSIDSFERKLEDAQDTLGADPRDYIPVTYVSEMSWQQELLRLAPTILLIAGYIYFTRRMQGGFGMGGGSGGMGGRGIFNVGKAQVTKLSKKQKDKVCLLLCDGLLFVVLNTLMYLSCRVLVNFSFCVPIAFSIRRSCASAVLNLVSHRSTHSVVCSKWF